MTYPQLPKRRKRPPVYFFLHPIGLRNRPELKGVRDMFSRDGLLVMYLLFEVLSETPDFTLETYIGKSELLAKDMGIAANLLTLVMAQAKKDGLITVYQDKDKYYIRSSFLEDVLLKGVGKMTPRDVIIQEDADKGKYIARPRDLQMVVEHFEAKGYPNPEHNAEAFYNYYETIGWIYGPQKKKIVKWKAAASRWRMDDTNGVTQLEVDEKSAFGN